MALLLLLAFALDGATTLAALARGGVETNPLVAGLGPADYLLACALRAAAGLTLLALVPRDHARRPLVVAGLLAVAVGKLAAAASNAAWLLVDRPLLDGGGHAAASVALLAGIAAARPAFTRRWHSG